MLVVIVYTAEEGKELVVGAVLVVGRSGDAGSHEVPGHGCIVEHGETVNKVCEGVALCDGHFLTEEGRQGVIAVFQDLLKVVVEGVGVTIAGAEDFLVLC